MKWYRLTHKATGECMFGDVSGLNLDEWDAVEIAANRSPEPWQDVLDDGTMVTNQERKDWLAERDRLAGLPPEELLREAELKVLARLAEHGKVTQEEAEAMVVEILSEELP